MHGFRRIEDDETERINSERKMDDRGSLDKGEDDSLVDTEGTLC